jgi:phosphoenolpyruvate phosphomutase
MSLKYRILPSERLSQFTRLLKENKKLRVMEAHDGLSALIASTTILTRETEKLPVEFDAIWVSSLTDSAAKGHPDTGVIDNSSRLQTVNEIMQIINKPVIVDGDTGGEESQFEYLCSKLEMLGVSAVIIEDKQFPKRNSLESGSIQILEDPVRFVTKINRAKEICLSNNFMIFARIESFIAGFDLSDALYRAEIYLQSKADGIMIHSSEKTADQVLTFAAAYQALCKKLTINKPLICVPTTYHSIYENELFNAGFSIIIYANHLLRAAHKAMKTTCYTILTNGRSFEATPYLSSTKELFEEVGFLDVTEKDNHYKMPSLPVILLAAGEPEGFRHSSLSTLPISLMPVDGTPLLNRQLSILRQARLSDITLITGYAHEKISLKEAYLTQIYNDKFSSTKSLYSLFLAEKKMKNGFIMIFGDVIFDSKLITSLLKIKNDIVLLIDPVVNINERRAKKSLDLVIISGSRMRGIRKLHEMTEQITEIGSDITPEKATHEFIGIAKFSASGADILFSSYYNLCQQSEKISNQNKTIQQFDFCDLIRYMIRQNIVVEGLEVREGWSEVHCVYDINMIEKMLA